MPRLPAALLTGLVVILLAGGPTGHAHPPAPSGGWIPLHYEVPAPSGAASFRIDDPQGIVFEGAAYFRVHGWKWRPIVAVFVSDAGIATPIRTFVEGDTGSFWANGENVTYAGALGESVTNPSVKQWEEQDVSTFAIMGRFPDTGGWLVLMWADHELPVGFHFNVQESATFALAGESAAAHRFGIWDFDSGTTAGITPAAKIVLAGKKHFEARPGHQLLTSIRYHIGSIGVGQMDVASANGDASVSFEGSFDPLGNCLCVESGTVLAGGARATVSLDYVGEGRTFVFGLVAELPTDVLGPFKAVVVDQTMPPP